jgi:hypothetical protein
MRLLADAATEAAARQELLRRGFSHRQVQLAGAVVDPDPAIRERVAQDLPKLSGIDPRPWLLFLCRDESPAVRAAAARWLATSNDPRIRHELQEMARRETDDALRQTLSRQ